MRADLFIALQFVSAAAGGFIGAVAFVALTRMDFAAAAAAAVMGLLALKGVRRFAPGRPPR